MIRGPYAPRDSCATMPGFAAFRARLVDSVRRRDAKALAALAALDVELDFGGGAGRAQLLATMQGRGGEGAERWGALDRLIGLGCSGHGANAALPWFYDQDLGGLEPYNVMLVAGEGVPMTAARQGGPVVARLSWVLVDAPEQGWEAGRPAQLVRVHGGHAKGYVATTRLLSQIDYRLLLRRQKGQWRIIAFIAGD